MAVSLISATVAVNVDLLVYVYVSDMFQTRFDFCLTLSMCFFFEKNCLLP